MLNKSLISQQYNKTFLEFLNELAIQYPGDLSLQTLITFSSGISYVTPELFTTQIISYIEPYEEHIVNENEAFFLSKDFSKQFNDVNYNYGELSRIIKIWTDSSTDPNTKWCVKEYLKKIVELGRQYKAATK